MKKQPKAKSAKHASGKHARTTATPSAPPSTPVTPSAAATPKSPRGASARLHRSQLTAAGLRGRDLVRYLRIHAKKPYGDRGVSALIDLAREVGRLGNIELNAIASIQKN
ncbi:MAG: hypothetical protein V7647_3531 [Acidobacteriota bacterium]|jgi:hypothetical protein